MRGLSNCAFGIRACSARRENTVKSPTIARRPSLALQRIYIVRPFSMSSQRPSRIPPFLLGTTILTSSPENPSSLFDPLSRLLLDHSIHSFGLTIILVTLLLRTTISLPAVFWQRNRLKKSREMVEPEMRRLNKDLAPRLAVECRRRGMTYEAYYEELKAQVSFFYPSGTPYFDLFTGQRAWLI